jgi:hypothetical protein
VERLPTWPLSLPLVPPQAGAVGAKASTQPGYLLSSLQPIETPAATLHRDEDVTRACGSFLGVVGVFCFSVFFFCDSRPLFALQCFVLSGFRISAGFCFPFSEASFLPK